MKSLNETKSHESAKLRNDLTAWLARGNQIEEVPILIRELLPRFEIKPHAIHTGKDNGHSVSAVKKKQALVMKTAGHSLLRIAKKLEVNVKTVARWVHEAGDSE